MVKLLFTNSIAQNSRYKLIYSLNSFTSDKNRKHSDSSYEAKILSNNTNQF